MSAIRLVSILKRFRSHQLWALPFLLALCMLVVGCNAVLRALPGPSIERPTVSPGLDQRVKDLQPPAGKSILYVYQLGDKDSWQTSDVFIDNQGLGRIWPGTYLFAIVDPESIRLKSEVQIRYSDRRQSYPVAYHNAWGILNLQPGQKYFVLLRNDLDESHTADQYAQGIASYYELKPQDPGRVPSEFSQVELSFINEFDIDTSEFARPNYYSCEFEAKFERRTNAGQEPVPCSFEQSF